MRACINQIAVEKRRKGFSHAGAVYLGDDRLRKGADGGKKFSCSGFSILRCRKHFLKIRTGGKDRAGALEQNDADFGIAFGIRERFC